MAPQDIPPTATSPDYGRLKQETLTPDSAVGQLDRTLDDALPANRSNPLFTALRNLVREFMAKGDSEYGLPLYTTTQTAMWGVEDAVKKNPKLADTDLVRNLTHTAQHCGELIVGSDGRLHDDARSHDGGISGILGRGEALRAIGITVDKRPDVADATLVKDLLQITRDDPDSGVRAQAQNTLTVVADRRPDLIDKDMVKAVSQAAESPVASHRESDEPWVIKGRLRGGQSEETENDGRDWAQQTLQVIRDKRPDLVIPSNKASDELQRPAARARHSASSMDSSL